ncbi:MAG TPA: cell division protein FtsQ/DivIB [Paracoccus sp. (in: a-proteobacteria)]|nr:cell division protein FtsQ/DivIB [Paracoccus sp. (in: a-proteobacteria)]
MRPAPARPAGARPQPARGPRRDPAPSRLAYRLHRLWLTPLYRRVVRVGLPVVLTAMIAGLWLSDETRRASVSGAATALIDKVQSREEFMVRTMEIEGASPAVDKGLRAMLPVTLPASSFDFDLAALRAQVEKLDAVERVDLRIRPGGILSAVVTERQPAVLWRHARGIDILDHTGHRVASVTSREVRRDLPMIAGEGAGAHAAEALALIDAAGAVLPRLRGLERMGERRWDVVLDRGQRIMLPAGRAVPALERVMAMDKADGLLTRDVVAVDMRNPHRPVLRLGFSAQNMLRRAQGLPELGPDGQVIEPADDAAASAPKGGRAGSNKPAKG